MYKEEVAKKCTKITSMFRVVSEPEKQDTGNELPTATTSLNHNPKEVIATDIHLTSETNNKESCHSKSAARETQLSELNNPYPADRGNFPRDIIDPEVKKNILNTGPCQPRGPFPEDDKKRSFSTHYYTETTADGQTFPRIWLCYSPKLGCAYCQSCWLFADRNVKTEMQFSWIEGVHDWQGLSKKIKAHETSVSHLRACLLHDSWKNEKTVDVLLNEEWKERVNFWKEVLKKIVTSLSPWHLVT